MELNKKLKILVVDDSATVRQTFTKIFSDQKFVASLHVASDPLFAMEKMKAEWPDVIILDIEMPRMDGLTFLKKIMAEHPTPVVICSSLTQEGTDVALQAIQYGALEVITKPKIGVGEFLEGSADNIFRAVVAAASSRIRTHKRIGDKLTEHPPTPVKHKAVEFLTTDKVIVIGASTGGTIAVETILSRLPPTVPGILVVQHMPEKFTAAFAQRLNQLCEIEVKEAVNGDRVLSGRALVAPGNYHMQLIRTGGHYTVDIKQGPIINHHRPSVDVLFRSVAKSAGPNALGILLTGMGDDGAAGMLEMKDAGAYNIAQDEDSCVVWGMPGEAYKRGAVDVLLHLDQIADRIISHWK